ncbi:OmpH family outer membrane protein [Ferruginibacter lapsinanis]|uniref:OmpH family outer membrane protein n=1 Tax=Ferruginibacter lapsinanis TaxID=563172 RepID=UPI001E39C7B1|nr:OmpH family outer membrane protein [Ferruginibacter lapsinanis]UEG51003.1 OmpH family outer membrane protein [Ferruginibacter lapsinanis]
MKKLFTVVAVGLSIFGFTNTSTAQTKIGYISIEELISVMPEAKSADSAIQDYQYSLQLQGNDYIQELNEKDSAFVKDSAKLSTATKELKRNDLLALYQKVSGWDKTMQQMIGEKQQTLIAPIQAKAIEAIRTVAKENGYTYVLDANTLIVSPTGDNLLPLVKKKLNIKDTPPTTKPAVRTGQ